MARVFISHRGADNLAAQRLASALRRRGHDVWIDAWKINVGDSIVEQIETGLHSASFFVLCLSSASTASPWMSREWMSALARQLEGQNVRVLPVRLSGGTPPSILADIKYADLVADWHSGVNSICQALGRLDV